MVQFRVITHIGGEMKINSKLIALESILQPSVIPILCILP
jgi:hypothetical protein